jgi:hypothetical protein
MLAPQISLKIKKILLLLLLSLLWVYSPLLGLGRFSVSWSCTQSLGLFGWGSARRKASHTHRTIQTQDKRIQYRHPCLEWDSNPRCQHFNERNSSFLRPSGYSDRQEIESRLIKYKNIPLKKLFSPCWYQYSSDLRQLSSPAFIVFSNTCSYVSSLCL